MSKLEHKTPPKGETLTLTRKDRSQSWCTWHKLPDGSGLYDDLNSQQGDKLRANIKAKLNELLHEAIFIHLGRTPSFIELKMELHRVKWATDDIRYYWDDTQILFYTEPTERVTTMKNDQGGRYYLTWYHRILVTLERN